MRKRKSQLFAICKQLKSYSAALWKDVKYCTKMRNSAKKSIRKLRFSESIVLIKVRGYNVDVGVVVSNEVDKNGVKIRKQREIDFVCNLGSKRYYIQRCSCAPL